MVLTEKVNEVGNLRSSKPRYHPLDPETLVASFSKKQAEVLAMAAATLARVGTLGEATTPISGLKLLPESREFVTGYGVLLLAGRTVTVTRGVRANSSKELSATPAV